MKKLLLTAAVLALTTGMASASGLDEGWYVGGGLGWNHAEDADFTNAAGVTNQVDYNEGGVGNLAVGYSWMNGLRSELEGSYRTNGVDNISGTGAAGSAGDFRSWNAMANLYYDFKNSSKWVPYIGAGVGASWQNADGIGNTFAAATSIDEKDVQFAYQGMAGVDYWLNDRSAWGLRYNYFASNDGDFETSAGADVDGEYANHAVMVTYRYGLNKPAAAPVAPAAMAAPAMTTARTTYTNPTPQQVEASPYKIFFELDKATITSEGMAVVNDVVSKVQNGRIDVVHLTANTDTSGSASHNEKLSKARANAVRNALVSRGINADNINVFSNAENNLPVPTADGVKEPRNRVVTIVIN
ncbi:MAG TPA: outer membrane beta-barrel protein [Alphaproteobacteria bacterium]|nr:hypothetical protein [Rhodospirillaceae bacterium]HRJ12131.1 outer membrane beta-barrel protein [Alphaproteobacteria bacterium]